MADDVFDDDDGIVHEDTDAEDEGEERDPVQCESPEVEDQQGEGERGGNGDGHDAGFAPAEREPDEEGDRDDGDAHVQQEFVRFLGCRFAVVAGDGDGDVGRDEGTTQAIDLPEDFAGHGDGIGARAFGDAQGHCGFFPVAAAMEDILGGVFAVIADGADLAEVDGTAGGRTDDHIADIFRGAEEGSRFHEDFAVGAGEAARAELPVRLLEHGDESGGSQSAGRQLRGIELDADGAARSSCDGGFRDERNLTDGFVDLGGEAAQGQVIVAGTVEGEGEDGDIVDAAGLDDGWRHAHRNAVEIGAEFFRHLDEAAVRVFADLEADNDERFAVAGGAVEVFDSGDFPEQFLHGAGGAFFDFRGGGTWHGDHDIDHGNLDLRFLFAREQEDGGGPEQDRGDHQQRGQFGIDERGGDPSGEAGVGRVGIRGSHGWEEIG